MTGKGNISNRLSTEGQQPLARFGRNQQLRYQRESQASGGGFGCTVTAFLVTGPSWEAACDLPLWPQRFRAAEEGKGLELETSLR